MATFNDWHKLNLSKESRYATTPVEFNKSNSINTIYKIQEQHMAKAKQSGDSAKIKAADQFCKNLETEVRFIRNSK